MTKKCPYFKSACIENECGVWDEGLGVCSMVSIALGNWSFRSLRANRKKLKEKHPVLHKYRSVTMAGGLVAATLVLWYFSVNSYAKDGDASAFLLPPLILGMLWYWVIKGFFDDEAGGT